MVSRHILGPTGVSRRDLLVSGIMMTTATVAFARLPRAPVVALRDEDKLDDVVPERVGVWLSETDTGLVMPPADEARAAAVYEDQLTRSYSNGINPPIMLLIAYDRRQSGMLMIHRPESCYPGSGFRILSVIDATVRLAPGLNAAAKFLSTQRDTRIEQVLYWTRLGNGFPASWDAQRWSIALQNLRGLVPDGALVRLSMITPDARQALRTMRAFAGTLFAASGGPGRALLGGPATALAAMDGGRR